MSDRVLLKSFLDRQEAEIARGLLQSNGIDAFVSSDACGQEYPNLEYVSGVQLMVAEDLLDEARRILTAAGDSGADLDAEAMEGSANEAQDSEQIPEKKADE